MPLKVWRLRGESILIGDDIEVVFEARSRNAVMLSINAPDDVRITFKGRDPKDRRPVKEVNGNR